MEQIYEETGTHAVGTQGRGQEKRRVYFPFEKMPFVFRTIYKTGDTQYEADNRTRTRVLTRAQRSGQRISATLIPGTDLFIAMTQNPDVRKLRWKRFADDFAKQYKTLPLIDLDTGAVVGEWVVPHSESEGKGLIIARVEPVERRGFVGA